MELRTILLIAIFVGVYVSTNYVSKLYNKMRQPKKRKDKNKPIGELVQLVVKEDRHLTRQMVNSRNVIIEETDYTVKHADRP